MESFAVVTIGAMFINIFMHMFIQLQCRHSSCSGKICIENEFITMHSRRNIAPQGSPFSLQFNYGIFNHKCSKAQCMYIPYSLGEKIFMDYKDF